MVVQRHPYPRKWIILKSGPRSSFTSYIVIERAGLLSLSCIWCSSCVMRIWTEAEKRFRDSFSFSLKFACSNFTGHFPQLLPDQSLSLEKQFQVIFWWNTQYINHANHLQPCLHTDQPNTAFWVAEVEAAPLTILVNDDFYKWDERWSESERSSEDNVCVCVCTVEFHNVAFTVWWLACMKGVMWEMTGGTMDLKSAPQWVVFFLDSTPDNDVKQLKWSCSTHSESMCSWSNWMLLPAAYVQ